MLTGENISFSREGLPLFTDLSFALKESERLTIRGPNGSGKSTLLRLLAGLIPSQTGSFFWKGQLISRSDLKLYEQNLLYIGHKLGLHPQAHVKDQLQLWQRLYQIPLENIERALHFWGVHTFRHKKISHLSQGQQKRLSLSRCHWLKRPLWILDEPEAGLDQEGKRLLLNALAHHIESGGSIVHATHEGDEVINTLRIEALERGKR